MSVEAETEKKIRLHLFNGADPIDKKTTIQQIFSLELKDSQEVYTFATENRPLSQHPEFAKLSSVVTAIRTLKKKGRGQSLRVNITTNKAIRENYFDNEGNPWFNGDLLDEIKVSTAVTTEPETKTPVQSKSLQSITKDAILEKFNGNSPNPATWIQNFERETDRLNIVIANRCVAIRLFLDGIAKDWYHTTYTLIGTASWEEWKKSFTDYFCTKGWLDSTYAINYRFIGGLLSEYVIHKLSLITDIDPTLSETFKILLVIAGLPNTISCKIDKDKTNTVSELIAKINQLDRSSAKINEKRSDGKNEFDKRNNNNISSKSETRKPRNPNFKPCNYSEKAGRMERYHPEAECKTKTLPWYNDLVNKFKNNAKTVKQVNKTELEDLLKTEAEQKN